MKTSKNKVRADERLVSQGLAPSVQRAGALILAGEVFLGDRQIHKPGELIGIADELFLKSSRKYVGRGAQKLLHALATFDIDPTDFVCADIGSSTGGFTQVLLEKGASRVYAIDSAYGELDWKLRSNERVVVMERTNILQLEELPELPTVVTVDVSLLSIREFLPKVITWLTSNGHLIVLVKPQYEATREQLPAGAVIRDGAVHQSILETLFQNLASQSVYLKNLIPSPIKGGAGNKEFLALLSGRASLSQEEVSHLIRINSESSE